jgi:electron transfer flavoprotein beta subunit
LNVVVCVKQVPDTAAEKKLSADLKLDRASVARVLNPFDEYAVEEAIRLKEKGGHTITVLSMGPDAAKDALRTAIAMGADKAVQVTDPALAGADLWTTSYVLAKALQKLGFDLVICGMATTDAGNGIVPGALAENLGLPLLSFAGKLDVEGNEATVRRTRDGGYDVVSTGLPAVVSVTKAINEPRYPTMRGIMQSKKAQILSWKLADIGVDAGQLAGKAPKTAVLSFSQREARKGGKVVKDDGNAAVIIADFLQANKII